MSFETDCLQVLRSQTHWKGVDGTHFESHFCETAHTILRDHLRDHHRDHHHESQGDDNQSYLLHGNHERTHWAMQSLDLHLDASWVVESLWNLRFPEVPELSLVEVGMLVLPYDASQEQQLPSRIHPL
jgi:hypothetical protein